MNTERAEVRNFQFALTICLALVAVGLWQAAFIVAEFAELKEWMWLSVGWLLAIGIVDFEVIELTIAAALVLYLLLIGTCVALRPRRRWALMLAGSAGFLPTALGILFMIAYVLEWPLRLL